MLPGMTTQHVPEAETSPICCLNGLLWAGRSHGPCPQVGQLNTHRLFTHQDGQNRESESLLLTSLFPSLFLSLTHTHTLQLWKLLLLLLLQPCPTLCSPTDGSPLGSPVPGILQARTVSGLPLPSPMHESENESAVAQSCPTLSDPTDCSLPGFSVHRIFWKELQEALFQEAGKGSSQDVGKEILLRGRIGGHLFCVANLYLEGTG